MGWIGLNFFFLTHYDGLGQKIPSIWLMHTPIPQLQPNKVILESHDKEPHFAYKVKDADKQ